MGVQIYLEKEKRYIEVNFWSVIKAVLIAQVFFSIIILLLLFVSYILFP